jgi:tetratricopeptide (TPR) repeat protein
MGMSSKLYVEINAKKSEAIFRLRNGKKVELGHELANEARALFATMPDEDPDRAKLAAGMAELMLLLGELAEAERLIKLSLEIDARLLTPNILGTRYMFLAQLLKNQERWDEAEDYVQRAIEAPFGEIEFSHAMLREIREAKKR